MIQEHRDFVQCMAAFSGLEPMPDSWEVLRKSVLNELVMSDSFPLSAG